MGWLTPLGLAFKRIAFGDGADGPSASSATASREPHGFTARPRVSYVGTVGLVKNEDGAGVLPYLERRIRRSLVDNDGTRAKVIADTALYLNTHLAAKLTGVTIPVDAAHLLIPGVNANPVRG